MRTIKNSGYVYGWLYGVVLSCKNIDQVGTAESLVKIAVKNESISKSQSVNVMRVLRGKIENGFVYG